MEILNKLVSEALEREDGDCEAAKERVVKHLKANRKLLAQVYWPLVYLAISEAVECNMRDSRKIYWNDGKRFDIVTNEPRRGLMAGIANAESLDIYLYSLRNGKHLGDANWDDLDLEEKWHFRFGKVSMQKSRWFRSLKQELPDRAALIKNAVPRERVWALMNKVKKIGGGNEKEAAA